MDVKDLRSVFMEEASGDVASPMTEFSANGLPPGYNPTPPPSLTVSNSFREGKSSSRRRAAIRRPNMDGDEFINLLHGSDPVKVELNRLENEVRGVKCGSI